MRAGGGGIIFDEGRGAIAGMVGGMGRGGGGGNNI